MPAARSCPALREAGVRAVRVCRARHRCQSNRDDFRDARSAGPRARSRLSFRAGGSELPRQVSPAGESGMFRSQGGPAGGSVLNSGLQLRVSTTGAYGPSWQGGGSARSKKSVRAARFWPADGSASKTQALTSYLLAASQLPVSCSMMKRRRCARAACCWFEVLRNFRNAAWPSLSCGRRCLRNGRRSLKSGAPDGSPD